MTLRTAEQYLSVARQLKPRAFLRGRPIDDLTRHPVTATVVRALARVYELAGENEAVMTAMSPFIGERVSRNLHLCQSREDLRLRADMALLTSQATGTCNYRCVGCDALHALGSVTFEMDRALGGDYHERFLAFLRRAQREDLVCSGALTDPKGDRSKRPAEQDDPDLYLRVVSRDGRGIVVRGAKVHQSGALVAEETLVMPGLGLRPGEEQYAVAFAVANGTPGLTHICQYTPFSAEREVVHDIRQLGNPLYGVRETSLMVFDDVFIPWERVFMCGEVAFTRQLVARFARMHRMNCGGACKVGYGQLIIGAAQVLAEQAGTAKAPHVVDKLGEMVRIIATSHACAIAAAAEGREEPEGSGIYFPDGTFGNVAKLNSAEGFYELMKLAGDIGGGLVVTMPAEAELACPETAGYVRKYLRGTAAAPAAERLRMAKFVQNWAAGLHGVGTWHGAGSPQAQRMAIYAEADLEQWKQLARRLAGLAG